MNDLGRAALEVAQHHPLSASGTLVTVGAAGAISITNTQQIVQPEVVEAAFSLSSILPWVESGVAIFAGLAAITWYGINIYFTIKEKNKK